MTDVLIIGAGPAGMSAATELQTLGLNVTVADDQPAPGGRIFAALEERRPHGVDDRMGAALIEQFRRAGGTYLPETEIWQIEAGPRALLSHSGKARLLQPDFILMATGAQERPMPFTGWQLPGVMTVGSAQILLKVARQIPSEPVWLAGTGPLMLLYAHQLISAGGQVAGILETTPAGSRKAGAPLLAGALGYGWRDLLRGLEWTLEMSRVPKIRGVISLEAIGPGQLESVRYRTRRGDTGAVATGLLLTHDGVIPAVHGTLAAGCEHRWNPVQRCYEPVVDEYGCSSNPAIYIAGDGATIAGAKAATFSGRLAAVGIARAAGLLGSIEADRAAAALRAGLHAAAGFRRFVDAMFPPAELTIADEAIVCRCEEVTAATLRAALHERPSLGADGLKIDTRAGMGPCQGRQCGLTLARLIAEVHGRDPRDQQPLRIRPPLKPVTLEELASLGEVA